jgi:hypothetical protein
MAFVRIPKAGIGVFYSFATQITEMERKLAAPERK